MIIRWMLVLATMSAGVAAFASHTAFAQAAAQPGFGKDPRRPQGTPFALPAGVELAGPLLGADDDGNCPKPQTARAGSGLWVRACMPVRNRTGAPVTIIFPPGLVIVTTSEGFQNGLLVERQVVVIPPTVTGGGRLLDKDGKPTDIVHVPLHLYCLNQGKDPSVPGARYVLGPVTQHSGLSDLYAFMADKDYKGDGQRVEAIQEVVWEVIKRGRFTAKDGADIVQGYIADE
ncbi:MAG: hypothetical protein MT490_05950 [Sphingomonas sp.]|uniref:hypothetical protein n=1 Tax=Sphingomonas sp. TaxID=28214 RepID=UPI0022764DA8|nr:hypothetical protein [Sphingomonas sp.]MCX8475325.1 hypothetical protein [Sphingomonas sp.]